MEKHFVTFLSPGTFVSETSEKEISAWDTAIAMQMARDIKERYNETPYGFYFTTRARGENDLDSKVSKKSNLYYLGGRIETIEEVFARNDPKESILRANMKGNGINRIIVSNDNSWRFTSGLNDDVILDFKP